MAKYIKEALSVVVGGTAMGLSYGLFQKYYIDPSNNKPISTILPLNAQTVQGLNDMRKNGKNIIVINEGISIHTYNTVKEQLDKIKNDGSIDIVLNTSGGEGQACNGICNLISTKKNHIRAIVPSHTWSAGMYIMFECNEICMAQTASVSPIDVQAVTSSFFGLFKKTMSVNSYLRALNKTGWNISLSEAIEAIDLQKEENKFRYGAKQSMRKNGHCPGKNDEETENLIDGVYDYLNEIYPHNTPITVCSLQRRGMKIAGIPDDYKDVFDLDNPANMHI
jgi:ClpP class serine protease